jgi:hypothetical protein
MPLGLTADAESECINLLEVYTDAVSNGFIGQATVYDIPTGIPINDATGGIDCDGGKFFNRNGGPC